MVRDTQKSVTVSKEFHQKLEDLQQTLGYDSLPKTIAHCYILAKRYESVKTQRFFEINYHSSKTGRGGNTSKAVCEILPRPTRLEAVSVLRGIEK